MCKMGAPPVKGDVYKELNVENKRNTRTSNVRTVALLAGRR